MTDTKRTPKPMTGEELAQYRELRGNLTAQAELVMSIFDPLNDREHVTEVEFDMEHPCGPHIHIWYDGYAYGEDYHEFFPCPENYLGMTEDDLRAEKKRIEEEEKKKREERAAKAKATKEKRKAEKAKKEAEKKVLEKDERYKKYLELKAEFEGATESSEKKSAREAVYECAHFEYEYDDLGKYRLCRNRESDRAECNCDYIYAQQFCPFYKKGKLRGKWIISDADKQAAEEFKKTFVGKEDNR